MCWPAWLSHFLSFPFSFSPLSLHGRGATDNTRTTLISHSTVCQSTLTDARARTGSLAFLRGKVEPFSRYLVMGTPGGPQLPHRARLPILCLLCQGRPPPCSSRASRACVFFRISCLITGSAYMFFHSPVRDNYLFGLCDPQLLYLSHASLRSVSGLFLAKR